MGDRAQGVFELDAPDLVHLDEGLIKERRQNVQLEEARVEVQKTGIQSYLGMALLAAGQTEREFERNGGNSLLAHIKNGTAESVPHQLHK